MSFWTRLGGPGRHHRTSAAPSPREANKRHFPGRGSYSSPPPRLVIYWLWNPLEGLSLPPLPLHCRACVCRSCSGHSAPCWPLGSRWAVCRPTVSTSPSSGRRWRPWRRSSCSASRPSWRPCGSARTRSPPPAPSGSSAIRWASRRLGLARCAEWIVLEATVTLGGGTGDAEKWFLFTALEQSVNCAFANSTETRAATRHDKINDGRYEWRSVLKVSNCLFASLKGRRKSQPTQYMIAVDF